MRCNETLEKIWKDVNPIQKNRRNLIINKKEGAVLKDNRKFNEHFNKSFMNTYLNNGVSEQDVFIIKDVAPGNNCIFQMLARCAKKYLRNEEDLNHEKQETLKILQGNEPSMCLQNILCKTGGPWKYSDNPHMLLSNDTGGLDVFGSQKTSNKP